MDSARSLRPTPPTRSQLSRVERFAAAQLLTPQPSQARFAGLPTSPVVGQAGCLLLLGPQPSCSSCGRGDCSLSGPPLGDVLVIDPFTVIDHRLFHAR